MRNTIFALALVCAPAMAMADVAHAQDCEPRTGEHLQVQLAPAARAIGYTLEADSAAGQDAVVLSFEGTAEPESPAAAIGVVSAAPYRGRSVTVSACVMTTGEMSPLSGLWLRVDRPGGMGFFDNMADRPFVESEWRLVEVTGPVAEDATRLTFGIARYGAGSITVRGLTLTVID